MHRNIFISLRLQSNDCTLTMLAGVTIVPTVAIPYELPTSWISFDPVSIAPVYAEAKAAVIALQTIPSQRAWVERLQALELKMEVAGTSRIEGADFTERELEAALGEDANQLKTRSQRQARAALETYAWLRTVPPDQPITPELVRGIHRRIVTGADDDHCPPGELRGLDHNVTFGSPRHRGCDGGPPCELALQELCNALASAFRAHDPLVQAMAAHYHLAAMHPFLDGNGRTARALEALLLQRAGLRDSCFVAMSNYYYDEKTNYLKALADVRAARHDLTTFLVFALRGVHQQVHRLLAEIQRELKKALFRDVMFTLFGRLRSARKRVIAKRQLAILGLLLRGDDEKLSYEQIRERMASHYRDLKKPEVALVRDLTNLLHLRALRMVRATATTPAHFALRLSWPTEITETAFFQRLETLPKAKTHRLLPGGPEWGPEASEE